MKEPQEPKEVIVGDKIGVLDEYGTIWSGEPGASIVIGDLVPRPDEETYDVHINVSRLLTGTL